MFKRRLWKKWSTGFLLDKNRWRSSPEYHRHTFQKAGPATGAIHREWDLALRPCAPCRALKIHSEPRYTTGGNWERLNFKHISFDVVQVTANDNWFNISRNRIRVILNLKSNFILSVLCNMTLAAYVMWVMKTNHQAHSCLWWRWIH